MDLATIIGLIGALAILTMAMLLSGSISAYIDIPSVLIVFVGSTFVVLMKYGIAQFLGSTKVALKAFMFKLDDPLELIAQIVELADAARKGGLLSLEGKEVKNPFLQKGIQLLVDGHDPEVVKTLMGKDMNQAISRHEWGAKVFQSFGDVGPAMGMIGTLVGLVAMLGNMDDPKSIGPAMAVALLTTLYGAILATMVCIPIADKLKLRRLEEALIKSLVIDALLAIQGGQNPRVIDQMLRNYLPEGKRSTGDEE